MGHHISTFFSLFSLNCFQICQQKLLLANIDTRKEDFHVVGKDYQEAPEYIEDCPKDTTESVQIDTVLILP